MSLILILPKSIYFQYIWTISVHLLQNIYQVVDDMAVIIMSLLLRGSSILCNYSLLYCYHLLFVITIGYSSKFHEYANHDHCELLLRMGDTKGVSLSISRLSLRKSRNLFLLQFPLLTKIIVNHQSLLTWLVERPFGKKIFLLCLGHVAFFSSWIWWYSFSQEYIRELLRRYLFARDARFSALLLKGCHKKQEEIWRVY